MHDPALSGGQESAVYTVLSTDTLTTIATGLKTAINADSHLSTLGVTATSAIAVVSITSISTNATTYTESTSASATETITLTANTNVPATAALSGTKTTSDALTLTVYDAGLSGGTHAVSYTVLSTDTLTTIAAGLASAVNANSNLQNIGVTASSSGAVVTILSNSINSTTYRESTNSGATEIVSLSIPVSGWQTAVVGGSKTTSDTVSITFFDSGLSTGTETDTYTVLSTDTLSTIAAGLAAAINADSNLSAIGVTATSSSTVVNIESTSPHVTTYSKSTSSGATETITLGTTTGATQSAYNNVNELVSQAPGGSARFQGLTNKALASASVASQVVSIKATAAPPTNFAPSVTGVGTETITFSANNSGNTTATVGGTPKTGDVVSISVTDSELVNGPETISYTVLSTDTTTSIAADLAYAIAVDTNLSNLGIGASSSSNVVTITSSNYYGVHSTIYAGSVVGLPSETVSLSTDIDTTSSVTLAGTPTVGDVVEVTVENANLSGGQASVSYTVATGNTLSTIASSLASAINASTALQAINVSGTSSSAVLSMAVGNSTYTESVSGSATETITFGSNNSGNIAATIGGKPTTGDVLTLTTHNGAISGGSTADTYTVLSTDTLVTIAAGLAAAMNADSNLETLGTTASNSNAATLAFSQSFTGNGTLPAAASVANVTAIDGGSNVKTNGIQLLVATGTSSSLTYDLNGNLTSDGTNSYSWDAENRLLQIAYPGSGNYSAFSYDGFGRNVQILEYVSSSLSSTKQFVWNGNNRTEARDSMGTIIAQYSQFGETISGTSYYFTKDYLGSIREMYSSGVQAQYAYDPFGQVTKISEVIASDLGFDSYYNHQRSNLNLTLYRAYSPEFGRWISRDPVEDLDENNNNYAFVDNAPTIGNDALGLLMSSIGGSSSSSSGGSKSGGVKRKYCRWKNQPDLPDCYTSDCCDANLAECRKKCNKKYKGADRVGCFLCCGQEWANCNAAVKDGKVFDGVNWQNCFQGDKTKPPKKAPSGGPGVPAPGGNPPPNTTKQPTDPPTGSDSD